MIRLTDVYRELGKRNCVYRYRPDQLAGLQARKLGLPYQPPSRQIDTRYGPMIEEAIPTSFEPVIFTPEQSRRLRRLGLAWDRFFTVINRDFRAAAATGMINGYTGIARQNELTNLDVKPGYQSLLPFVRLDCVEREDGGFSVFDVNSSRPIGVGLCVALTDLFTSNHLVDLGIELPPFITAIADVLDTSYAQWCVTFQRSPVPQPHVSIVIQESHGSVPDFKIIARRLKKTGRYSEVELVDPADLAIENGRLVIRRTGSTPTDIVLRTVKPDLDPTIAPVLAEAYPTAACITSPFYRRWLGSKLWFALATQPPLRPKLEQELGYLAGDFFDSLPECGLFVSGQVTIGDRRYRVEELKREEWVVKIAGGSSARGVILGRSLTQGAWLETIMGMYDSRLLFQRFTPSYQRAFTIPDADGGAIRGPFHTKIGLYIIDGRTVGCEFNACLDSLKVHGGRGTLQIPAFLRPETANGNRPTLPSRVECTVPRH